MCTLVLRGHRVSVEKVLRIHMEQPSAPHRGPSELSPPALLLGHFQQDPGCTHGNATSKGQGKPAAYGKKQCQWKASHHGAMVAQLPGHLPRTWGPSQWPSQGYPGLFTSLTWSILALSPFQPPSFPPSFFVLKEGTEVDILGKPRPHPCRTRGSCPGHPRLRSPSPESCSRCSLMTLEGVDHLDPFLCGSDADDVDDDFLEQIHPLGYIPLKAIVR